MRAAQVTSLDGPSAVALAELPEPAEPSHPQTPGEGVIVYVRAAGVAFPDALQTRGLYQIKPPLPFVPGVEKGGGIVPAAAGMRPRRRATGSPPAPTSAGSRRWPSRPRR